MREKGFTLIEMMISVVIGTILIAAVVSVFLSTKQSYRMGQGLTLMQSTGRATLDFLSRELSMAGFPQASGIESFIPALTTDGGGNNSDQMAVRYRATTDCFGKQHRPMRMVCNTPRIYILFRMTRFFVVPWRRMVPRLSRLQLYREWKIYSCCTVKIPIPPIR